MYDDACGEKLARCLLNSRARARALTSEEFTGSEETTGRESSSSGFRCCSRPMAPRSPKRSQAFSGSIGFGTGKRKPGRVRKPRGAQQGSIRGRGRRQAIFRELCDHDDAGEPHAGPNWAASGPPIETDRTSSDRAGVIRGRHGHDSRRKNDSAYGTDGVRRRGSGQAGPVHAQCAPSMRPSS